MQFKDFWKNLTSMVAEEGEGEAKYRDLAETFDSMADDEKEHKENLEEMKNKGIIEDANKSVDEFQKPGDSIHSTKWDRCVENVKSKGSNANAYAICTAQLGEESFKSFDIMTKSELSKARKEVEESYKMVGTAYGGSIPNSLLSRQDLEGDKTITKSTIRACDVRVGDYIGNGKVLSIDKRETTHRVEYFFTTKTDEGKSSVVKYDYDDTVIIKGAVESTGKKLESLVDKADDVTDSEEKYDLVDEIKNTQKKRQKAIINARNKDMKKSFLQFWKDGKEGYKETIWRIDYSASGGKFYLEVKAVNAAEAVRKIDSIGKEMDDYKFISIRKK